MQSLLQTTDNDEDGMGYMVPGSIRSLSVYEELKGVSPERKRRNPRGKLPDIPKNEDYVVAIDLGGKVEKDLKEKCQKCDFVVKCCDSDTEVTCKVNKDMVQGAISPGDTDDVPEEDAPCVPTENCCTSIIENGTKKQNSTTVQCTENDETSNACQSSENNSTESNNSISSGINCKDKIDGDEDRDEYINPDDIQTGSDKLVKYMNESSGNKDVKIEKDDEPNLGVNANINGVYTSNKSEDSNGRTENNNTDTIITKSNDCGCKASKESSNGINESYA